MLDELIRSGLARLEYVHILGHGQGSVFAAMATECAGDQGAWWEFHDHYMTTRDLSRAGALAQAARSGLDSGQFAQCLDSEAHLETVRAAHQSARDAGVNRTPTIRINGRGAATIAEALIEQVRDLATSLSED